MTSSSHEKYEITNVSITIERYQSILRKFHVSVCRNLCFNSIKLSQEERWEPKSTFSCTKTLVEIRRWKIYCVFGSHIVFISIFSRSLSKESSTFCLERLHRSPVVNVWVEIDFYEKLYRNHQNGKQGIHRYMQQWSSRGWFIHLHDHHPSLIPWLIPKW